MRRSAVLGTALVAGLLTLVTGCSTSGVKSSCKGTRCTVTVQTTSSAETKLFKQKYTVRFSDIQDDRITVSEGAISKVVKEGASDTVGRVRVEVKDADPGEAELVITPA